MSTANGLTLITYPDPESHRNGTALQDMLCKYADVDQVNAALRQIDAVLTTFQNALAAAVLGPGARAQVHLPNESPDGVRQAFSFTDIPSDATAFLLVWGGIVQAPGNDFSVSSGVVTMIQVPKANDNLFAFY